MGAQSPAMQAWVADAYGLPGAMVMRTVSVPVPGQGMVLLRVSHVALNPLDVKLLRGELAQMMPLQFPFTPAADLSGEIVACGPGVEQPTG